MKVALVLALTTLSSAASAASSSTYLLDKSLSLGAPDRWDYVVFNPQTRRVLVAHADRVAVIDGKTERLTGEVHASSGGPHGSAISLRTEQGFSPTIRTIVLRAHHGG